MVLGGPPSLHDLSPEASLDAPQFVKDRRVGIDPRQGARSPARAHEDPCEGVIITLRDSIKLVVMTLGTGDRRAKKALANGVNDIRHRFLGYPFDIRIVAMSPLAQAHRHRANEGLIHAGFRID